jgi:(4S)-4-hydroxy-5-phosphonooxypentane-2,3-dione isomerase
MSKVILRGFIIVPEPELDAIKQELPNHKRLTQEELGCLVFDVIQCKINPHRFDVYEEFVNKAAFDYHQERVQSSYWGKLSINVERHYEIFE